MILVTGASGFIGKHLLKALTVKFGGSNVLALTSQLIKGVHCILHHNYQFDQDLFLKSAYAPIETIIHVGAFTPKNSTQANDVLACNSNVTNTEKLIFSKNPELKKIIYLSTLDVYQQQNLMIDETTPINPTSVYGNSKFYCEKMVEIRAQQLGIPHQILRVGHVYGPGEEKYQKIIPITIKKLLEHIPLSIFGTGKELRSFIYIDDLVETIVNSIALEEAAGPINLVSENAISIHDLILQLINIANSSSQIAFENPDFKGRDLIFDNSKMKSLLLKRAETPLPIGLKREFDYMMHLSKA